MSGGDLSRRAAVAAALAAGLLPSAVRAQATVGAGAPAAPAPKAAEPQTLDDLVTLDIAEDGAGRMTVPVTVDGRGPFRFMVDTGSDHSVLSEELAAMLQLPAAGACRVHGIAGSQMRARAQVGRLDIGGRALTHVALPLLPRRDLGALGYIGLDGLKDQRLSIDFASNRMQVRRSRGFAEEPGEIVVTAKSRFGQLMLVDSSVRKTKIFVILDSGAQDTIGNPALRSFLEQRRQGAPDLSDPATVVQLSSVTGQTVSGQTAQVADLVLGGVQMRRVPVVYADLHTFRMFKLDDEPALMLGMSTLRAFNGVTIDFGRRQIGFQLPPSAPIIQASRSPRRSRSTV